MIESFLAMVAIACAAMWISWHFVWKEDGTERFPKLGYHQEEDPRLAVRRALEDSTRFLYGPEPSPLRRFWLWLNGYR